MKINLKQLLKYFPYLIVFATLIFTLRDSIVRWNVELLKSQGIKHTLVTNWELIVRGGIFQAEHFFLSSCLSQAHVKDFARLMSLHFLPVIPNQNLNFKYSYGLKITRIFFSPIYMRQTMIIIIYHWASWVRWKVCHAQNLVLCSDQEDIITSIQKD